MDKKRVTFYVDGFISYLEKTLDEVTAVKAPRLREVSEEDRAWAAKYKIIPAPTKEQLDADPKLARIINKGL